MISNEIYEACTTNKLFNLIHILKWSVQVPINHLLVSRDTKNALTYLREKILKTKPNQLFNSEKQERNRKIVV